MNSQRLICIALAILGPASIFAQSLPSTTSAEGLELLKRVAQHYVDAKSYHIEAIEERTSYDEFHHDWNKTIMTAAEAPGNRFHYDGRSFDGSTVRIGNGKTVWTYRVNQKRYTQKPVGDEAAEPKIIPMPEMALMEAERLRKDLGELPNPLKAATRLEDATLSINGRQISCYVVNFKSADMKRTSLDYSFDKTIWINKNGETIVRIDEHAHSHIMIPGGQNVPIETERTTTFSLVELDRGMPDDFFTFTPPLDAKLVEKFPDPRKFGPDIAGEQAPALKFKSAEGTLVSLDSFRGKPVLLDVWATWCAPCVKGIEEIARIYADAQSKGLILLSVDEDEDAKTATDFLAKKNFAWPNFHDDGEISKVLGSSGIPRTLLIDEHGKVVYDTSRSSEDDLRAAVVKLGPDYASLAPKPKEVPCSTSK
jgi:thiol-disulfide isomerase/thioredoxin